MWLEMMYRSSSWTSRNMINLCYSPDPKVWWWYNMEKGTSGYRWDFNPNISCCDDLLFVERYMLNTHPEVNDTKGFSWWYRFCIIDGYRMAMATDIFYPDAEKKLPWTLPIEKQTGRGRHHNEWNADTYHHNGNSFLLNYRLHTNWEADGELFTMNGLIRKGNSTDLLWRYVHVKRVGFTDFNTYRDSIWGIKVVEWMLCGSDTTHIYREDYPKTSMFRRTWFDSERLPVGCFLRDVVWNTAVSMFLNPEPPKPGHS